MSLSAALLSVPVQQSCLCQWQLVVICLANAALLISCMPALQRAAYTRSETCFGALAPKVSSKVCADAWRRGGIARMSMTTGTICTFNIISFMMLQFYCMLA